MIEKHELFEGFPNDKSTWNFPMVIDGWVNKLSGSEFKVLWYIVRHTFGWQKTKDKISYSQFQKGIRRKNGTWLDRGTGLCNTSISNALKKLVKLGFIEVEGDEKSGKTSCYKLRFATSLKNGGATSPKTGDHLSKNWRGTSLKTGDTIFNTNNKKDTISAIISYLNQKHGTDFDTNENGTIKRIQVWLDKGHTLEDFKRVIDLRVKDWESDPKMCKHLNPETLFGPKFKKYLNEKPPKPKKKRVAF